MKRQLLLFMTPVDETAVSEALLREFPRMAFIDENVWSTPTPRLTNSISESTALLGNVYLWNRALFPEIPVIKRADGRFQGPGAGPVFQFLRCRREGSILRSASLAAGFNDDEVTPEIESYLKKVWRMFKSPATSRLYCVSAETGQIINPKVERYWAWPDAVRWSLENGHFLADRATRILFRPYASTPSGKIGRQ